MTISLYLTAQILYIIIFMIVTTNQQLTLSQQEQEKKTFVYSDSIFL